MLEARARGSGTVHVRQVASERPELLGSALPPRASSDPTLSARSCNREGMNLPGKLLAEEDMELKRTKPGGKCRRRLADRLAEPRRLSEPPLKTVRGCASGFDRQIRLCMHRHVCLRTRDRFGHLAKRPRSVVPYRCTPMLAQGTDLSDTLQAAIAAGNTAEVARLLREGARLKETAIGVPETEDAWFEDWSERISCWMEQMPNPEEVQRCTVALSLHLASKLEDTVASALQGHLISFQSAFQLTAQPQEPIHTRAHAPSRETTPIDHPDRPYRANIPNDYPDRQSQLTIPIDHPMPE